MDLLDEVALAFGDLARYDAIVVGLRAYELRPDVPRSNPRLLQYVQKGGTLLVQYERDFAWNKSPTRAIRFEDGQRRNARDRPGFSSAFPGAEGSVSEHAQ